MILTETTLTELKSLSDRLANLLNDPQPGLWSWCDALRNIVSRINHITGVP